MRSFKQHMIFSLLIILIFYDELMTADSPCGDWELYKDEKCIKVINETLRTYDDAEKTCNQQENSATLVTIHSKNEQDFLSNLLFKTLKVVDTIWIGAKYSSNKFKWIDDSELSFTNWAEESPKNKSDTGCVQMTPEGSSMGKWVDEPCNKKNLVVCQKMQTWSLSRLQKTLLDSRKKLSDSLEDARKEISDLRQNLIPVGFIYVQLPSDKSPTEIWPWMAWNDVSSAYAGVFFRVTGGEAASFGSTQDENYPTIVEIQEYFNINNILTKYSLNKLTTGNAQKRVNITTGDISKSWDVTNHEIILQLGVSDGEVRPRNMAIRVWKRTG